MEVGMQKVDEVLNPETEKEDVRDKLGEKNEGGETKEQ